MKKWLFVGLAIYMGVFFAGNAFGQTTFATTSGYIEDCDGTPLVALVLANGQHMFSNSPVGEFLLDVPLDSNGEIKLYAFVAGFLPFKAVLTPSEASFVEIVLYKCEEVDYCYDSMAHVVFVNNLSCGGTDFTATVTYCGWSADSVTGVFSSCVSMTPQSCYITINADGGACGNISMTGNYAFEAGCLTVIVLDLENDEPVLVAHSICPGDCSTDPTIIFSQSPSNPASFKIIAEGAAEGEGYTLAR